MSKKIVIPVDPINRSILFLRTSITPRIILSIIITSAVIFFIKSFLPDDELTPEMLEMINDNFVVPPENFAPEQKERISYILALILLPSTSLALCIMAWHYGSKNLMQTRAWNLFNHPIWKFLELAWFPMCFISIVVFARESQYDFTFGILDYFIFISPITSEYNYALPGLATSIIITCFIVYYKKPANLSSLLSKRIIFVISDLASITLVLVVAFQLSLIPETIGVYGPSSSMTHIGPLFEPAAISYLSTATPAVNLASQYGGFTEFARPFLYFFSGDPIGLFWFAFFALVTSLFAFWVTVRRLLSGNAILALISLSGIIYLTSIKLKSITCFQCSNFRWFWPSIYLLFVVMELPRSRYWSWLPYTLFPFAIYWNPETGLASMAAWMGWQVIFHFTSFIKTTLTQQKATELFKYFSIAVISFTSGTALLYSVIFIKTNDFPEISLLFQHANIFYLLGFGMLPMPIFHLWNIYALIAITLFTIGVQNYLILPEGDAGRTRRNSDFLIYSTLLFGALFAYYQGRSFHESLLAISYPLGLALVAWLGLGMRDSNPNTPPLPFRSHAQLYGLLLIIFGVSSSAMAITNYPLPPHPSPFALDGLEDKKKLREFVRRTAEGKRPFFISYNAWRYILLSQQTPEPDIVPLAAMFRRDQLSTYLNYVKNPEVAVYFDLNNEELFGYKGKEWIRSLIDVLNDYLNMENIPENDYFIGEQGRLVRLRLK